MIAASPVEQRSDVLPDFHRTDMPDQNGMGMVMECGFELAVEDCQGIFKCGGTCLEAVPPGTLVAVGALASANAGKGLRDVLLVGRKHVDAETAIPLQRRPGGRGPVDADDDGRPIG